MILLSRARRPTLLAGAHGHIRELPRIPHTPDNIQNKDSAVMIRPNDGRQAPFTPLGWFSDAATTITPSTTNTTKSGGPPRHWQRQPCCRSWRSLAVPLVRRQIHTAYHHKCFARTPVNCKILGTYQENLNTFSKSMIFMGAIFWTGIQK